MRVFFIIALILVLTVPSFAKDFTIHHPNSQLPIQGQIDRQGDITGVIPGQGVITGQVDRSGNAHVNVVPFQIITPGKPYNPYVGGYDPANPLVK